jgi:hypothetical protein
MWSPRMCSAFQERIRGLAQQAMQIGDPGQIRPIVKTSIRHFAADQNGPHIAAPLGLLAANTARRQPRL